MKTSDTVKVTESGQEATVLDVNGGQALIEFRTSDGFMRVWRDVGDLEVCDGDG